MRIGEYAEEELAASRNPFATVVLIARTALVRKRMSDNKLMELKLKVSAALVEKGFDRKRVVAVMLFLEKCLRFKAPENNRIFREKLSSQIGKNNPMGIIEMFKEECKEEGREEGREKGREEGREEGRENIMIQFMRNTQFSNEEVAGFFNVPVAEIRELRKNV